MELAYQTRDSYLCSSAIPVRHLSLSAGDWRSLRTGSPREQTGFEAERSTARWIVWEKAVSESDQTLRSSVSLAAYLHNRQVGKRTG